MESVAKNSGKTKREEREAILKLKHRYDHRVRVAKQGKQCYQAGDYGQAIRKYTEYLEILAEVFKCDAYSIKPDNFEKERELTEILIVSHIYFELSRIYDLSPNFKSECEKCLNQFVIFTANQRFQVVNSEMIRKYIKKDRLKNPELFKAAYLKIQVNSKQCYIATFCFGDQDPTTERIRLFKSLLLKSPTGSEIVRTYYYYSSRLIQYLENRPILSKIVANLSRPVLRLFSRFF